MAAKKPSKKSKARVPSAKSAESGPDQQAQINELRALLIDSNNQVIQLRDSLAALTERVAELERPKSRVEALKEYLDAPRPNAGDGSGQTLIIDPPGPAWGA